jgi:hypothetical protein
MFVSLVSESKHNPLVFLYEHSEDMNPKLTSFSFVADEIIDYHTTTGNLNLDSVIIFESAETDMTHHISIRVLCQRYFTSGDILRIMQAFE